MGREHQFARTNHGGNKPYISSAWRMSNRRGALRSKAATSALPMGVRPTTLQPIQMKWSSQRSVRGLNKGYTPIESGSGAEMRTDFLRFQLGQAQAKLDNSSPPP